jgi:hypothetical protein
MIQKFPITTGGLLMTAVLLCLVLWAAPGWSSRVEEAPAVQVAKKPVPATDGAAPAAHENTR